MAIPWTEFSHRLAYATFAQGFLEIEGDLLNRLLLINYGPQIEYVYNPIAYAYEPHSNFYSSYLLNQKKVLFLGMNPGPWGMVQNGVPFGEAASVREFLHVTGQVSKPVREHPLKPVKGLSCTRSEVSGKRFWSLAANLSRNCAATFFLNTTVYNYFPLCLLDGKGRNITPPELKADVLRQIEPLCDEALLRILLYLQTEVVVAIGRYAEKKIRAVLKKADDTSIKDDTSWMEKALTVAETALAQGEVPVGCLFTKGDKILAQGSNEVNRTKNATRHAEMDCIDKVLSRFPASTFSQVTVYVTVEPCAMCAAALHSLEVSRIIYGCANDRFGGCGSIIDVALLYENPVEIVSGVLADRAMNLLKKFYLGVNPNAPPEKVKLRKPQP